VNAVTVFIPLFLSHKRQKTITDLEISLLGGSIGKVLKNSTEEKKTAGRVSSGPAAFLYKRRYIFWVVKRIAAP